MIAAWLLKKITKKLKIKLLKFQSNKIKLIEIIKKKKSKTVVVKIRNISFSFFAIKLQANENYTRDVIKSCTRNISSNGNGNNEYYKKKRTTCYNFLYLCIVCS